MKAGPVRAGSAKGHFMFKFWDKLIKRASLKALGNLAEDENYLLVRQNPRFKDLSAEAFLLVMKAFIERRYAKDEVVFQEGNPGICMFIIKSGRVQIFSCRDQCNVEGKDEAVYTVLERGALFGEMSVVSMSYRSSAAKALDPDTVLLTLSAYDLEQLMQEHPRDGLLILRGITDSIVANLVSTNQSLLLARSQLQALKEKLGKYE